MKRSRQSIKLPVRALVRLPSRLPGRLPGLVALVAATMLIAVPARAADCTCASSRTARTGRRTLAGLGLLTADPLTVMLSLLQNSSHRNNCTLCGLSVEFIYARLIKIACRFVGLAQRRVRHSRARRVHLHASVRDFSEALRAPGYLTEGEHRLDRRPKRARFFFDRHLHTRAAGIGKQLPPSRRP